MLLFILACGGWFLLCVAVILWIYYYRQYCNKCAEAAIFRAWSNMYCRWWNDVLVPLSRLDTKNAGDEDNVLSVEQ